VNRRTFLANREVQASEELCIEEIDIIKRKVQELKNSVVEQYGMGMGAGFDGICFRLDVLKTCSDPQAFQAMSLSVMGELRDLVAGLDLKTMEAQGLLDSINSDPDTELDKISKTW
jgi:hypothetical protein